MKRRYWYYLIIGIFVIGGLAGYYYIETQNEEGQMVTAPEVVQSEPTEQAAENSEEVQPAESEQVEDTDQSEEVPAGAQEEPPTNEDNEPTETESGSADQENNTASEPLIEEETREMVNEVIEEEESAEEVYSYRKDFKDPFFSYRPQQPQAVQAVSRNVSTRTGTVNQRNTAAGHINTSGGTVNRPEPEVLTPERLKETVPFQLKGIVGSHNNWVAIIEYNGKTNLYRRDNMIGDYKIVSITYDSLTLLYKNINFTLEMRSGLYGS